jgi:hypothetical protein
MDFYGLNIKIIPAARETEMIYEANVKVLIL